MTIQSVFDPAFSNYGQVLTGYDLTGLLETLEAVTPVPEGTDYVPEQPELMALPVCQELADRAYGGMPHRDSELNVGVQDFILLVAKREDMADGRLDTGKVQAFLCPAGTLVEVYATTLHYAPCSAKRGAGFQVAIVLPKGTNLDKPAILPGNQEDQCLWARNKWLLAHKDSSEAAQGAPVRLDGENVDIAGLI